VLELHAIIKGYVQGVGFRWTVVDVAEKFNLTGTTKNLPNGTVEIYAQGSKEDLEAFIKALQSDPGQARIESVLCRYQKSERTFIDFKIVH
jgi:acylphosphatase